MDPHPPDKDANDAAANWADGLRETIYNLDDIPDKSDGIEYTWPQLRQQFGIDYPAPVIQGLLREHEILTIVSGPKVGKSMLCYSLAMSVLSGEPWLNPAWFPKKGSVAIFDNESDPATISARLEVLRKALGKDVDKRLRIFSFFGKRASIEDLQPYIDRLRDDPPVLIIFDSLFYFLPKDCDENSNPDMARVYQTIRDLIAPLGHTAAALVHHAAKGVNADRDTIDMGRGAGAIGAATGTMLTLRQHEKEGHFIVEAVCRSWPQPEPATYKLEYPLWLPTEEDSSRRKGAKISGAGGYDTVHAPLEIEDEEFASYLSDSPQATESIVRTIRDRHHYTRDASLDLVRRIRLKHHVDEVLSPDDNTWQSFGAFEAKMNGRRGTVMFRRAQEPPS